jgi:eukaryotic-like serine/threonine-protein kinase
MTSPSAVASLPVQRRRAWSTATSDRQLVRAILDAWNQGEPPDAAAALARHPQLAEDRDAVVDLAYEEYCLRVEAGERIDHAAFAACFAPFVQEVRDTLDAHGLAADHLELIRLAPTLGELKPGDHLLGFTLLRELGEGSFSRVFLASEQALGDRLVAIKVSVRGAAEAETLGRLNHPNIVPVHSFHEDPESGLTLVCMPYLGNATLADLVDRALPGPQTAGRAQLILDTIDAVDLSKLSGGVAPLQPEPPAPILRKGTYVEGVLHLGAQVADALAFIHQRGICHRDLKPANVLLGLDGAPRLLDFNLSFDELLTGRRLGGTPPYTAPEQLQALAAGTEDPEAPLDARADIFSLGVLLFEMLTGQHPFGPIPDNLPEDEMFELLLERHRRGPAPLLRAHRFLGAEMTALLERCLAFDRSQRPASAAEVCTALRRALSVVQRTRRWVQRHARGILAAGILLLVGGGAGAAVISTREPPARAALRQGEQAYAGRQFAEAEQQLTLALLLQPEHAKNGRVQARIGYCLNLRKDHRAAIVYYEKALEAGFGTAEVYNNLGYSWARGRVRNTIPWESYTKAIQLNPNLQAAYHNRAMLDLENAMEVPSKVPHAGIADIEVAITIGPATADLYRDAACLYALGARSEPQLAGPALKHLRLALDNGFDPAKAAMDACFHSLQRFDEYHMLIQQPPGPKPTSKSVWVVDPIQDGPN